MPLWVTESEQEYWLDELDRLQKYAVRAPKIRCAAGLMKEGIPV
jgi:hypothetical protein